MKDYCKQKKIAEFWSLNNLIKQASKQASKQSVNQSIIWSTNQSTSFSKVDIFNSLVIDILLLLV